MAFREAACKASVTAALPIMLQEPGDLYRANTLVAASSAGSRHPASAVAKKLTSARIASCRTSAGTSCHVVRAMKRDNEALTRAERVDTLTTLKRYPEAHAELAKVQALAQGHEVPYKRATVHAQISEAELSAAEGRPADAHRQIDAVIDALQKSAHPSPVTTGLALLTAARIANADGRFAEAEQRATEALKVTSDNALDVNASADVGEALLLLAKAQQGLGRASESSASARRAVVPLTAGVGAEHALTRQAVELGGSGT